MGAKTEVAKNTDDKWKGSRQRMVIPVHILDTMDEGKSRAVLLPPGTVRVLVRKGDGVVLKVAREYVQEQTYL